MIKAGKAKINCRTFQKQEPLIRDITERINGAEGVSEKAKFAEELRQEMEVFFFCSDYDGQILDCKNCRVIAQLRRRTANLIIKAAKLA